MGWFWGNSSNNQNDPTKQLEPGLREYLDKEAPAEYAPTKETSPPSPQSYKEKAERSRQSKRSQADTVDHNQQRAAPPTLFPDGRYADLWKNYRSIDEIEEPTKSPEEKVINDFRERRNSVERMAMENCAEEHLTLTNCFKLGDFSNRMRARMTMCQLENSKFARCYTMQGKFLTALGYGDVPSTDPERQERVQMHADKLYHQMLDYEARVEEAKAAGIEPPSPKSLFNSDDSPQTSAEKKGLQLSDPEIAEKLKDLTPHERELELQVLQQRKAQKYRYAEGLAPALQAHEDSKAPRREKFTQWFGPTLGRWLA